MFNQPHYFLSPILLFPSCLNIFAPSISPLYLFFTYFSTIEPFYFNTSLCHWLLSTFLNCTTPTWKTQKIRNLKLGFTYERNLRTNQQRSHIIKYLIRPHVHVDLEVLLNNNFKFTEKPCFKARWWTVIEKKMQSPTLVSACVITQKHTSVMHTEMSSQITEIHELINN